MMALAAIMGEFDILVFEVVWHGDGLDYFFRPCLDLIVMAPQAQRRNLVFFFNGKCSTFFIFFNMIGKGSMAELTGDGLVKPLFMDFCLIGVTFET